MDKVLFEPNFQAGIIAHTLVDATNLFEDKLKYAFDHLRPDVRQIFKKVGDSAKELAFSHDSVIRVGTSLRSASNNFLHISEFGKICAKYPDRAREVISGSLNTVQAGQEISIESTAEGKEGAFYDMVQEARKKKILSPMDFKFFFFPWWRETKYSDSTPVAIPSSLEDYFYRLSTNEGIELSLPQKYWYVRKFETQKEDIYREFPSTVDEAFQANQDGYWFVSQLREIEKAGHFTNVGYDRSLPVHTAWDLGQKDPTSIWFFQINRSDDINLIDFWQRSNTDLTQIVIMLKEKGYNYGTHIWPHDANARDRAGITFVEQASPLGLTGVVLDPHGFMQGINLVRTTLSKCWFDKTKCAEGIKLLEEYKKKWNSSFGGWTSEPIHDHPSSHCADAFRYLCAGVQQIIGSSGTLEKDYSILRRFWEG